jgi:hypothetical protein
VAEQTEEVMIVHMTIDRAQRLRARFLLAGLAVMVVATALSVLGFRMFFMPLACVAYLLFTRSTHWRGWTHGYVQAGGEQVPAPTISEPPYRPVDYDG